jgi:hypothetical protein
MIGQTCKFIPLGKGKGKKQTKKRIIKMEEDHKQQILNKFWQERLEEINQQEDFKVHQLPLARIKKIMKSDEDVRVFEHSNKEFFFKNLF